VAVLATTTLEAASTVIQPQPLAGLPTDGVEVISETHKLLLTDRRSLATDVAAVWDEADRGHGLRSDPHHCFASGIDKGQLGRASMRRMAALRTRREAAR